MKKLLTLALILSSATAFATRSRITALGNSPHLVDVATSFRNPSDIMSLGDSLTIESGQTYTTGGNPNAISTTTLNGGAEGTLIRSMGDSKFAITLGHSDANIFTLRSNASAPATAIRQQNPLELTYAMKAGDMAFGATLIYSNFQNKTAGAEQKENSMGVRAGLTAGALTATVALTLADKWEAGTGAALNDYKGKTGISGTVGYDVMSDLYVYGAFNMGGFKTTVAGADTADYETMSLTAGVVSKIKKDSTEFFYGAGLTYQNQKQKVAPERTIKDMHMPLIIGLEAEANSWLTLRGSITQNLLLVDSTKDETPPAAPTTDTNPGRNSTTLAAGAGLKFNKVSLDGSILAAGSQILNSANLLGQVGLTYTF